jgi:TRAP-type C4-dicarboxylate transport system substrate-binding protein
MSEYNSAMERGLVDGINSTPVTHWVGIGGHEVTKYVVDHPYYQCSVVAIMNLKKWNQLSKQQQTLLRETMANFEKEAMSKYEAARNKAMQKELNSGVQTITFSPADAEWFVETAYDSAWAYQMKRFPEVTPKLKELLSK